MRPRLNRKEGQTILFIGDSITDVNRLMPAYEPYGFGYVHFTTYNLLARYQELNLNIVNTGISGNTVRDLATRWDKDCLAYKPDILSIMIGVNDVWRQQAEEQDLPDAVYIEEYEATYGNLLLQAKAHCDSQLVLIEPFMFCQDKKNAMFKDLQAYIKVVNKLASEFDAVVVPLQKLINKQLKHIPAERWSDDMVHPYLWAHAWISQRWLEITRL